MFAHSPAARAGRAISCALALGLALAGPVLAKPVSSKKPATPATSPAAPAPAPPPEAIPNPVVSAMSAPAVADTSVPTYWRTRAERSGYRNSSDYDETVRYCKQLEAGSRWVHYTTFGKSGQGRDLPLVIVSSDRAFTPEAARATGKPIVLIQNGIHAGEIEGKDACLALMRDLAVLRKRPDLLDHAILLVVPILSVDAHERRGRYNRINQNGPDEMGWRFNPTGLNLNRDYVKVETPEIRALLTNVFTVWWPHLLVDDHTTDGADYRYDLTYGIVHGAGVPPAIDRWLREAFEGRVVPRADSLGHLLAPYLTFRSGNDPSSGIVSGNPPPRFSNAFPLLWNRPAILVETHMLKPYGTRVKATYDLLVALLEEIRAHPDQLLAAVSSTEAATLARARATKPADRVVVLVSDTTSKSVPFEYKGYVTHWESSDISGSRLARYTAAPWDTLVPMLAETQATVTAIQPAGYLIPQEWTVCRDRMDVHRLRYRRFVAPWSDTVEITRIVEWKVGDPAEGHHAIQATKVAVERRVRAFRPGDLWVPLDQPGATLAMHLFEAQAPDGLLRWNAFDTIFEKKEYSEDYVMEPIARRMLDKDPALASEFQAKLASDSSFAKNPRARLDFLYRRSPWADPEQNVVPVLRAVRVPPERVLEPAKP